MTNQGGGPPFSGLLPHFADENNYDFRLTSSSAALINQGANPGTDPHGYSLVPVHMNQVFGLPTPGTPLPALATRTDSGVNVGAFQYP